MKSILFVCVENSCRSQIAEALARKELGCYVASAGSKPAGQINPQAIETMAEVGIDLNEQKSTGLDGHDHI